MRSALKRIAEFGLTVSGATRMARTRRSGQTIILAYHNIVPKGETTRGDTSLHLPQQEFARQLDALRRTHDVVPLRDAVSDSAHDKPRAVITFDDAYAGAVEAGVAELAKRSLPATIFVTPSFVGGASFWWDRFASADGNGLDEQMRAHALHELQGKDAAITEWARGTPRAEAPVPRHERVASEADLGRAALSGVITFGSHTWSHPNLARLSEPELSVELTQPLHWLQERFPNTLPFLAYPYGLYNAQVAAAARSAGYECAFRIDGGWLTSSSMTTSPYELPRWNVPAGISLRGFAIRTSGVL